MKVLRSDDLILLIKKSNKIFYDEDEMFELFVKYGDDHCARDGRFQLAKENDAMKRIRQDDLVKRMVDGIMEGE